MSHVQQPTGDGQTPRPSDPAQHLKDIVARAIALPAPQRADFISAQCAGDKALEIDVRELVAAHDAASAFLASPTHTASKLPTAGALSERAGTVIGPYKLLQVIGEGGFGTVFLAEQTAPVRRKVALKIIKLGMDTKQVVARFEAERQALALMDHPHIARVLDGGATPVTEAGGGRPFFVMEYVVGDAITKFADAHGLTVRERLDLFAQVCSAVQHAHTKGIIHRDLKPANVLVSMVDGKPFAKVIDFGIAKATGAAGGRLTDKTVFTEHRQLIGTPEYMSPEQAEGSPDIDTRTDIYALGVLLYELLTGTTPIEGERLRSAAWDEMRRMIREEEPPAPSMKLSRSLENLAKTAAARKAEPGRLSAMVKGELDWIVMKALEKERARRYETASALADDVKRHLAGEPVVAAPVSRAYRVRKFVRRNKGAVGAVGAVVLSLAAGGSVAAWQAREARIAQSRERERAEDAERQRGIIVSTIEKLYKPGEVNQNTTQATAFGLLAGLRARDEYGSVPEQDRGVWELAKMAEFSTRQLVQQTDAAERLAYSAILAAAGIPLADNQGGWATSLLDSTPTSRRGYEWNLVRARADRSAMQLRGHTADLDVAMFSPDGSWIITGSRDNSARVWDARTGRCLFVLAGHDGGVVAIAVCRDKSRIFTASQQGDIREWNGTTGDLVRRLDAGQGWPFRSLRLSPDETSLLTNSDSRAALVDLASGAVTWSLDSKEPNSLLQVRYAQHGTRLLVQLRNKPLLRVDPRTGVEVGLEQPAELDVGSDNDLWRAVWDASGELRVQSSSSPEVAGSLRLASKPSERLAVSSRGDMIAIIDKGEVEIWSLTTGQRLSKVSGTPRFVSEVSFVAGDSRLLTVHASGDERGVARLWDVATGELITTLRGADAEVWEVAVSPDRRIGVTPSSDGVARVWDLAMPRDDGSVGRSHPINIEAAVSSDGRYVASVGFYRSLELIDARRGTVVAKVGKSSGLGEDPASTVFLGLSTTLVAGTWDGKLAWYDADRRQLLAVSDGPGSSIGGLISSRDGSRLIVEDLRGVRVAADSPAVSVGRKQRPAALAGRSQMGVAIGSQRLTLWDTGRRALIAEVGWIDREPVDMQQHQMLRVFDPQSGRTIRELTGLAAPLIACEISDDGELAAAADEQGGVTVWYTATGAVAWQGKFDKPIWDLRIATKSRQLFAMGEQVFRVGLDSAANPAVPLPMALSKPHRLELSRDGSRLLVANGTGMLAIHDAVNGEPLARLQAHEAPVRTVATSSDGRLLLSFPSSGSARVWDIRDPEERRKDLQAEWAERVPAGAYLDTLWASDTPDDKLRDAVINDASLTPLRRLVAAEMLEERLEDDRLAAEEAFEKMKQAAAPAGVTTGATLDAAMPASDPATPAPDPASITNAVRAAAAAADLPPRVKARVIALAAGWEYKAPPLANERELAAAATLLETVRNGPMGHAHARTAARQVVEIRTRLLGPKDLATAEALHALGQVEAFRFGLSSGLDHLQQAAAIRAELLTKPDLTLALWESFLASAAVEQFDIDRAVGAVRRMGLCLQQQESLASPSHQLVYLPDAWPGPGFHNEESGRETAERWAEIRREEVLAVAVRHIRTSFDWHKGTDVTALSRMALLRWRLSAIPELVAAAAEIDGKPGSLTGGKVLDREGHRAAAREALAKARALMASAADGTPSPWASDEDAKALLAEAAALIEGQADAPTTPAPPDPSGARPPVFPR